jgi:hypothetical protein
LSKILNTILFIKYRIRQKIVHYRKSPFCVVLSCVVIFNTYHLTNQTHHRCHIKVRDRNN